MTMPIEFNNLKIDDDFIKKINEIYHDIEAQDHDSRHFEYNLSII